MSDIKDAIIYEVGEQVHHKASGRQAIITFVHRYCVKHGPMGLCSLKLDRSGCDIQPSQEYDISFDFDVEDITVPGYILEHDAVILDDS